MICENLNYGNSTIKDVNDVICEKLKNSDRTLSSSILIDFSLRHNMPRPIKTLLITSVPSSIKTPQDVEDLISKLDKMYSVNSTMKYYKDLIKKIFSPDLVEIITPHLAKVKLYFLKSFQNLVKPDLISARIYPQINVSLETAIHEAEKAMIAELVPIKQLLKLNNEWFPVGIKHNISS